MNANEFEVLVAAQRRAMMRDITTSNAAVPTGTPTIRKADLVEMLCDRAGLNGREAREMVEAFFEAMRDALEGGKNVKLSGFGCFRLRGKPQRPGRNPKTGIAVLIPARRVVTFHAARKLKTLMEKETRQVAG